MIRGTLCAILIILSLLPAIPLTPQANHHQTWIPNHSNPSVARNDPTGSFFAFNLSRAQFDLYTRQNANWTTANPPTWSGGNFTNPLTGATIANTTFDVKIPSGAPATNENVSFYKVLNIAKGNFSANTYLRFDWRGIAGNLTKASFYVYNATTKAPIFSDTKVNQTIAGGPPTFIGSPPVGCGPTDNCFDVTKYVGFNLTLTFAFNTNATAKGLEVYVSNVAVVSADQLPTNSVSHSMRLDPTDPTTMRVNHNATLTTGYFANVTYRKPNSLPVTYINHTWSRMILSYYYPNSYTAAKITQNGTTIFPTTAPTSPIFEGNCPSFFYCTGSHVVSLSMPSPIKRAGIIVTANSVNVGAKVETTLGGVPTPTWGPGDLLQVRVTISKGVNLTGFDYVSANKTGAVQVTQTFSDTREGISLLDFTKPLPQDVSLLGIWTVNSTFVNGYDFGFTSTSFTLQQLSVTSFSYSGDNQRLTARGTLTYAFSPPPSVNVNGTVFAIDNGAGAAPISTPTKVGGPGIYVSNITLVNGVFTSGSSLIMTFTLVNPTKTGMGANLTITHEWVTGHSHNSSVTIPVPPGSDTFTLQASYVYRLNATFTPAGIQIAAAGITSGGASVSGILPPGNPPVTSLRQHSGIFNITVTSKALSSTGNPPCQTSCYYSLESPTYAYVLVNPPVPGRLLASGSFTTTSTGDYTAVITSGRILGATKLTFLSLGIDASGLTITVQGPPTQEPTLLQSSLDNIPSVTQNQPTTLVLHLTSTSTTVNMNLSITLNIRDSGGITRASQTQSGIYILHGGMKDVQFAFSAPASVGTYTVTFLSSDYGAPLITGTLQVSVLQSSLQVLIPAIIGVAAAIVILLFFLFRKKPATIPEPTTKDKPAGGKPKPGPGSQPRNP